MKQCIRIGIRHNLIYLLMLIIFNFLRKVDLIVLDKIFEFNVSMIFIIFMFFGELLAGLIIYMYQISFLPSRKSNVSKGVKLISGPSEISPHDSKFKIYVLVFVISLFDFIEYLVSTYYIPQFKNISKTLEIRLSSFLTLSSALFFIYVLKLSIHKHHIFSLLIILACLIIIGISEYFFQHFDDKRTEKDFFIVLLSVLGVHFFNSLLDSVEKYLLEYDFVNAFKLLMLEGIFGTILSIIYLFIIRNNPFEQINNYNKNENTIINFIFLIICLCLYLLLSGGRNAYRVETNKIYSPMAKTLTDYILNPLFIVYYYIFDDDFIGGKQNKKNIFYFILNLILSIIVVFCGCIYNELLVLFCYNLEYDTHREVSIRAESKENIPDDENNGEGSSEEDNEEENEKEDNPNDS